MNAPQLLFTENTECRLDGDGKQMPIKAVEMLNSGWVRAVYIDGTSILYPPHAFAMIVEGVR